MNILVIIILGVFLLSLFAGYKNGFLKTVFSLISWIIALVVCNVATPLVADFLIEKTTIATDVQIVIEEKINEVLAQTIDTTEIGAIDAAIPEELKGLLFGEEESFGDSISVENMFNVTPLVESVMSIIAFLIVIVVIRIALLIVELVLGIASKLPLIGPLDKMLGFVCGAGKGLIWCWVILAVISVLALTGTNTEWAAYIAESELLTWLQENNILLNYIVSMK